MISPAAHDFLVDLAARRAAHEYREGQPLKDAKAIGWALAMEFREAMLSGFVMEVDGERCVVPETETQYVQGGLF